MLPERITKRLFGYPDADRCWEWQGALTRGYGSTRYGATAAERRDWYLHRLSYTLLVGPIPAGLEIDHLCRNKVCCNPAHLEPVTPAENRRRANWAKPKKETCLRGHPRTPENLTPTRNCRECIRERTIAKRNPREPQTHCKRGHEFTPENTYSPPGQPTKRACKACKNARKREARAERARRPTRPEETP